MAVTVETFELGEKALDLAVYSQSASRSKSLSEIISNGLDAGSDTIEVHITPSTFEIVDHGCGFETEDQIDEYFAQLSFDHNTAKHQADGYIGTHGIGRMQIQVQAKTSWRTNTFQMSADLKNKGLCFDKTVGLPFKEGCTVSGEWYTALTHLEYKTLITELSAAFQYCPRAIYINGTLVNQPIARAPDIETSHFSFWHDPKMKNTVITNCGVYVCHTYFLATGVAVSKRAMKLNTARTKAIESECRIWQDMNQKLSAYAVDLLVDKVMSGKRLGAIQSRELYKKLVAGDINIMKLADKAIVPVAKGQLASPNSILLSNLPVYLNVSNIPSQEHIDLHLEGKAVFIDLFGMDFTIIRLGEVQDIMNGLGLGSLKYEIAPKGTRTHRDGRPPNTFKVIEYKKLSARNKIVLGALESIYKSFVESASINFKHIKLIPCSSTFGVGYGGVSTNGEDEIYIEISKVLQNNSISPSSLTKTLYRMIMMSIYDGDYYTKVVVNDSIRSEPDFTTEHYHTFAHLVMEQAADIGFYVDNALHAALDQLTANNIKLKRDEGRVYDPIRDYSTVLEKLNKICE